MPELPEVETIRRNLEPRLMNRRITAISEPTHPRSLRYQPGGFKAFQEVLRGRQVQCVARRGKHLWTELSGSCEALCFHLGMSGQLRLVPAEGTTLAHERLRFTLDTGNELVFCDQRTFGHVEVRALESARDGAPGGVGTQRVLLPAGWEHIARDVLDPNLDVDGVLAKLSKTRRAIKTKLLEQGIVSGIGNIYADESLFAARIHPATPAQDLGRDRTRKLLDAAAEVMRHALDFGGTSFDKLYVNSWGNPGDFASELQVYGRGGKPCRRCGQTLDRIVIDGRSTVFCAHCTPPLSPRNKRGR